MTELPVVVPRPAEVIDLRRKLVEFFKGRTNLVLALSFQGRYRDAQDMGPGKVRLEAAKTRRWFEDTLSRAELYWISPDMVDFIASIAPQMPEVNPEPPVEEAFVVLAKPMMGVDSQSGDLIHTAGYLWGSAWTRGLECVLIATYGWRDLMRPGDMDEEDGREFLSHIPLRLVPTGSSDWPLSETTSSFARLPAEDGIMEASMVEDRRILATFWALCGERLLVEREERGDRHIQRRAERAGLPPAPVRVITLREVTRPSTPQGTEVEWSHRWTVAGHWRQQPFGPKREFRRAQWISPFVKGPADKPLLVRETVRALKR